MSNDIYNVEIIRKNLQNAGISIPVDVYDVIDSTSTELRRRYNAGNTENQLAVANEQTAGKGRRGRSFYSPKDKGIYFSFIYNFNSDIDKTLKITSVIAVAVLKVLKKYTGGNPGIKWVNDIYLDDRKVCGILVEGISDFRQNILKSAIIGIGINLREQDFPEELNRAGSINNEIASRNEILSNLIVSIFSHFQDLDNRKYLEEYRYNSILLGRDIVYEHNGVTASARVIDIDDNGYLIVNENGEIKTLSSGEISIRL